MREREELEMKGMKKNLVPVGLGLILALLACIGPAVAQTAASPELVGDLTKQLKVTPAQATGGAGSLFSLAKSKLKPEDFAKVSAAVPGMDSFLNAAPKQDAVSSAASAIPGKSSGLASVASQFKSLGLSPDMVAKFVPVLNKFVGSKGGAAVEKLLSSALK
jgi:uncharacterized protein VcgC/VcgE DUF2780